MLTRKDQTNRGDLCIVIPGPPMLEIVVKKFINLNWMKHQINEDYKIVESNKKRIKPIL